MNEIRFEIAKGFEDKEINLPIRSTKNAVGYDFEIAETIVVKSIWKIMFKKLHLPTSLFSRDKSRLEIDKEAFIPEPKLLPTGIKAKFPTNMGLFLFNRSSGPNKLGLILANGVGVVESDYYGSEENDGHLMFAVYNIGLTDTVIRKGTRIGQGVFMPFFTTTDDKATGIRTGGYGSTGK